MSENKLSCNYLQLRTACFKTWSLGITLKVTVKKYSLHLSCTLTAVLIMTTGRQLIDE